MRFTIALTLMTAACLAVAARPEKPLTAVADWRYGTALYAYYQGDYWDALTRLLIADSRGGIEGHGERPAIMEGAFSLAYGMENRASRIFNRVLDADNPPEVRDAAWFYLAQMRYKRDDLTGATQALANISAEPPQKIADQLRALRINLAIRQDELAHAASLLQENAPGNGWLPYLYYNLGAAYSRAGDFAKAVEYYNRVAQMPLWTEEDRTVYDRAMIAAGYSYMRSQQYPQAQAQFSRVRIASPLAGSAMLGYGWAAAEQGHFMAALTPWQRLAERSLADEYAQEALLAVPYAYEQLGNKRLALRYFQQAEQRFYDEIDVIGRVMDNLHSQAILKALNISKSSGFGQLSSTTVQPQLVYLTELFARGSFQNRVQQLRDLLAIQARLRQWQDKLVLYSAMLDERETRRHERMTFLKQQQLSQQLADMRAQRDQLVQTLARIKAERDYMALAAGHNAQLQQRVQAVAKNSATLAAAGRDVSAYREAHRRYAGILLWQASEAFAAKLWQAQKQLQQLNEQLGVLDATRERVAQAVSNAEDLQPYRQRIAANQRRLERQLNTLDNTIANAQKQLRGQVLAILKEQQERLRHYLAQSRLAVARLYDSARQGQP